MSYSHLLVAVAVSPESHQLLHKAVALARPSQARISLITLTTDPEIYNHFAAPMLENLRDVIYEETQMFLAELIRQTDYPIAHTFMPSGELSTQVLHLCKTHQIDLVVCGNHNHSVMSRALCSAKTLVGTSQVDVLLVSLNAE
ncbi:MULTISPECIES: universal stress protein UspC [unclassified Enterobacter]|uniref:universal stress protein UspC n=1 Tax=unclassified Enterobacter TaxID=2608935 RepID=UPI0008EA74C9|nr:MULTISPECIES: universal stress protein UspC [unclassified Enterobacter]SFR07879.1 universal stress protein C [Enterobacter sp. kpr-6]